MFPETAPTKTKLTLGLQRGAWLCRECLERIVMKYAFSVALLAALSFLAACAGQPGMQPSSLGSLPSVSSRAGVPAASPLAQLANLDYSNGSITVFSIENGRAKVTKTFSPGHGIAQGLAMDGAGRIYTTVTASDSKPCAASVEVFSNTGRFIERLDAPILKGAPGAPSLTDVAVDRHSNVYVSDFGQQAVYFYPGAHKTKSPTIVVQNSQNAASVLSTPNGANVVVSGGCGFASVRPYTRTSSGQYTPGSCFGIGTIALIGGAIDDLVDVMTPVDGVPGLVSVSSPNGGETFHTPGRLASISGVAFNGDASIAYVADHTNERVLAFRRPASGWLSGQPKLVARYRGFQNLDIIAVPR